MLTRRTLLRRAPLPLLGLGALGFMTRIRSQAQPPQFDPRLETNLLNTTLQTIGHPVPRNFHLLSGAYATFFESLKTAGMLPQLETAFFTSGLLQNITADQLLGIASGIEQSTGISITTSLPVITGWQTTLPVLNAMLAQSGCDSVHQQIVSFYRSLGDSVRPRDSSTNTPISGGRCGPRILFIGDVHDVDFDRPLHGNLGIYVDSGLLNVSFGRRRSCRVRRRRIDADHHLSGGMLLKRGKPCGI